MGKFFIHGLVLALIMACAVSLKSQSTGQSVKISAGKNTPPETVSDSVKAKLGLDLPPQARIKANAGKNANPVQDTLPQNPSEDTPASRIVGNKKQE